MFSSFDKLEKEILSCLESVPLAGKCIDLSSVSRVKKEGSKVKLEVNAGFAAKHIDESIKQKIGAFGDDVAFAVNQSIVAAPALNSQNLVKGVKNIICVASGKGGVGKSTTSVNIAIALAQEGANVGLLDADIYGPSQSHMLGLGNKKPSMLNGNTIVPLEAHGVKCISMGSLVNENTPMIWRGPMVSGALQQLLNHTQWKDIDYLIVDMPPGTGDIQLTLSQSVPITGAIVVTTPQDIALLDAKKAIEMFRKVNVPVLGVVENMALHTCSNCGHQEAIFGENGGEKLSQEFNVALIGRLPLELAIRLQTDSGKPTVAVSPDSKTSLIYREIAQRIAVDVWEHAVNSSISIPNISIVDD